MSEIYRHKTLLCVYTLDFPSNLPWARGQKTRGITASRTKERNMIETFMIRHDIQVTVGTSDCCQT